MKALLNIGMFLVPPLMAYILHRGNANRKGGGTTIVENGAFSCCICSPLMPVHTWFPAQEG